MMEHNTVRAKYTTLNRHQYDSQRKQAMFNMAIHHQVFFQMRDLRSVDGIPDFVDMTPQSPPLVDSAAWTTSRPLEVEHPRVLVERIPPPEAFDLEYYVAKHG